MAATLNSEDIALILAAVEGSTVLAKTTDLAALALEASLAPLALEASLAPLALEASLSSLALETSVQSVPTAAENADAVWDEVASEHTVAGSEGTKLSLVPGEIAAAVWDVPTINHTTVGSTGEAILATITALYPSAVSIAAALWAKIITGAVSAETALATLYNGWSSDAGVGSGAGAIATEITVNVGGAPADGVEVWVSSDAAGANVIAGTLVTDAFGKVTFMLDPGSYFLFKQRAGVNFVNPETIVVTL